MKNERGFRAHWLNIEPERYTDVDVKRNKQWRMLTWQTTRLPE